MIPVRLVKTKLNDNMNIETNIECFVDNKTVSYQYNHEICTIFDNKSSFLLDLTNLTEYEIINKGKIVCFNGIYKINNSLFRKDFANVYELIIKRF